MLGDGTSHLSKIMSKYIRSGDIKKVMARRFTHTSSEPFPNSIARKPKLDFCSD
jgi:hypothetical protein